MWIIPAHPTDFFKFFWSLHILFKNRFHLDSMKFILPKVHGHFSVLILLNLSAKINTVRLPMIIEMLISLVFLTLLLLLLSRFSWVRLCVTPQMAAHQAPPSLGFSRQEHWSGLPFPSPVHESEKWKWSHSVVSNSSRPHGLQPTRLLCPWDFPGKSTRVGCHCLLHLT